MNRIDKLHSRGAVLGGGVLALGILLVLLAGFSMGLHYVEHGSVGHARGIQLFGAIVILVVGVIWNLALRRNRGD
jgi:hypothetical protein